MYDEKTLSWFDKVGVPRPTQDQHGVSWEDVKKNLKPMVAKRWSQDGNRLIGHTEDGDFINTLPTNYILIGTDENNLPMFKKLDI